MSEIINKIQVSSIYGELVDASAPEPTIRFGVNGSNAKWGTDLCDDVSNARKLTFIKDMANNVMSQINFNESFLSQIKEVAKCYPIFDTYKERITKIDKTYAKIVANWICHVIDPSILCAVSIQDMIVFMVYQFGYIDNLKAFVHYDFSGYEGGQVRGNNKFIFSKCGEDLHFLDKRYVTTYNKCDTDDIAFVMDSITGDGSFVINPLTCDYYGVNGCISPTDPVMDLVEVVTSCCNRYYFEYGWYFHYPEFELLSKCEICTDVDLSSGFIIPVQRSRNIDVIREKLGLSNKRQEDSHKALPTTIPLLDIECIRTHMKYIYGRVQRYSPVYIFSIVYAIFSRFLHQTKSSNDTLTPYDLVTFTDKCLSSDYLISYGLSYTNIMSNGMHVIPFASTDVRYIQNRYVINHVRIMPEMKFGRFWPPYYDYSRMMDQMCVAILNAKKH